MARDLTGVAPLRVQRCAAWLATMSAADRPHATSAAGWRDMFAAPRRLVACAMLAGALVLGGSAGWIHAKAALAQVLLQHAWTRTLASGAPQVPWPWADTAPVARLRVAQHGIDQIVLRGDSGRTLAFGPGWAEASAHPGGQGIVMISGHRDTHFTFLRDLVAGDRIELQGASVAVTYRVADTRIADARHERLPLDSSQDALWLVTCWPFDAVTPGGPLRYAVRAVREDGAAVR